MLFHESNGIRYYSFNSFTHQDIVHAVFTRHGGVSPKPWESLNVGGLVGDESDRVAQNCERSFHAVGRDINSIYDVWQVHSAEVVITDSPRLANQSHIKADAILTNNPEVTLFMRFADCVPILLFDPILQIVGLVHAGWQGTIRNITTAAIQAMSEYYGCKTEDIQAGIGPSICCRHYNVGKEVIDAVENVFFQELDRVLIHENGETKFNLWEANRILLQQAGVNYIEVAGICTVCNPNDWFSHRGELGNTGRFGAIIGLAYKD